MTSLFDEGAADGVLTRLAALDLASAPRWGRMDAAQMLAHCRQPMLVALGEAELRSNFFLRILGRLVKRGAVGPKPFAEGLPTVKSFLVPDAADAERERQQLARLIERFRDEGTGVLRDGPHPFFGRLRDDEWGSLMWKHLDHHLRQFSV